MGPVHRTVALVRVEKVAYGISSSVPTGEFKIKEVTVEGTVEEAAKVIAEQGFVYDVQADTAYPIHLLLSVEPA